MTISDKYASQYNVHDFLKDRTPEEIKQYCVEKSAPAAMAMVNTNYDYNIGQVMRVANCFGFTEVYHIQKEGRRIDKRGACGTQHYTSLTHCFTEDEFLNRIKDKYIPISVEVNMNFPSINLFGHVPAKNTCFIFGAENQGLSDKILSNSSSIVTIPN